VVAVAVLVVALLVGFTVEVPPELELLELLVEVPVG